MGAVTVEVDTDVEAYPVLSIREARGEGDRAFAVSAELMEALDSAQATVQAIEFAIMERIAEMYPEAGDIADWVFGRNNDRALDDAMGAYEAENPNGPDWTEVGDEVRGRFLREAGWRSSRG
jgi:hypothetical protein